MAHPAQKACSSQTFNPPAEQTTENTLPDSVLTEIFSQLVHNQPLDRATEDLMHARLVCQRWNTVVNGMNLFP